MDATNFKQCLSIILGASAAIVAIKAYDYGINRSNARKPVDKGLSNVGQPFNKSSSGASNEAERQFKVAHSDFLDDFFNIDPLKNLADPGQAPVRIRNIHPGVPINGSSGGKVSLCPPFEDGGPTPQDVLLDRSRDDQRHWLTGRFRMHFMPICTCDECNPAAYAHTYTICPAMHDFHVLKVEPRIRPVLVCTARLGGCYEALTLARNTIEYFSRAKQDMDADQLRGWERCRHLLDDSGWMQDLNTMGDLRLHLLAPLTDLANALNELFFFNAIKNLSVEWNTEELDDFDGVGAYGLTITRLVDGLKTTRVLIHPIMTSQRGDSVPAHHGMAVAEKRLGSLLHELLHAFLSQYACRTCATAKSNGDHLRAWQRIAKAIEEQSWRLFEVHVHLGRMDSLDYDLAKGVQLPSRHDMEDWGFLDPKTMRLIAARR